jgi:hypothetical protein
VEDWAEIRRLHRAEGMPIKAIARAMGILRNTVRSVSGCGGTYQHVQGNPGPARRQNWR